MYLVEGCRLTDNVRSELRKVLLEIAVAISILHPQWLRHAERNTVSVSQPIAFKCCAQGASRKSLLPAHRIAANVEHRLNPVFL
jgi:hypothetical protein